MENSIFQYVRKYSAKQQVVLLVIAVVSFPFLYMSLDIPKTIVNNAIGGNEFPQLLLGVELDQTPYLFSLCGLFIVLVFFNGGFKYFINIYRGVLAERMLRRLRFQLIERVMRFPLHHFRNLSQGEIVAMVTTETEPLGGFFGEAYSLPCFQGGYLLTLIGFMFVQDPILGTAAIILYPIQGYMIPKLQRRVNMLAKERVKNVRKLSERISEMVSGVSEIHAHDTMHYELADFSKRLGTIFSIRYEFYRKKFFIKFLNNFMAQLTPFFFYSIGGYLVIKDDLTLGALVAVIAAYKDVSAPWKELLAYYQRMEDNKIKFSQIIEQFQPSGMFDEMLYEPMSKTAKEIKGKLVASNLSLEFDGGNKVIDGASFSLDTREHVAIVGSSAGGRSELAQMIARQVLPSGGKISIGDKNLATLPSSITGRLFAYMDQEAYIRSGTIMDALLYGLKHHPVGDSGGKEEEIEEAALSGNSPFNIDAKWVDFHAIGVESHDELVDKAIQTLRTVEMEDDIFQIALQRTINAEDNPALTEGVLKARAVTRKKLQEQGLAGLVEVFDERRFNSNASVAENILFGAPLDDTFNIATLGNNPHVLGVLEEVGLTEDFLNIGHSIATLMVELFQGLAPDHEFFERFSFIDSDDLPEFQRIITHKSAHGLENIEEHDRARLIDLTFKLIPSRHHLNLIEGDMRKRILEARRMFSKTLSEDLRTSIAFFDMDTYNSASCIQDNILFGKISGLKGDGVESIGDLLAEVIEELGLRKIILQVGLNFDVGIAGKRLSLAQRQKISIARCLLKSPQLFIYNQAAPSLDANAKNLIFERIREEMKEGGLIWVDDHGEFSSRFDRTLHVERGKVSEPMKGEEPEKPIYTKDEQPVAASELDEEANLLADVPFFANMDRSRLKLLAFTADRQEFKESQFLFLQGNTAEVAYVILEGSVDVIVDTSEGNKVVSTLGKGQLVGELALVCDAPRTASIRAKSPLTVLSISKDIFLKHIKEDKEMSAHLTRTIADRLRDLMSTVFVGEGLYDEITGLPNRELLIDRINYFASIDKRAGSMSSVILINMTEIYELENGPDPIDKEAKSKLLKDISLRLRGCIRDADTLAYLDGFRFGVIACAPTDAPSVNTETITKRIAKIMSKPFIVCDQELHFKKDFEMNMYSLKKENLRTIYDKL